jgi:hypothetical protein
MDSELDRLRVTRPQEREARGEVPTPVASAWVFSSEIARTIPYWFFATVGLVYASGFVAVELYLGSYGLRDVGAEFWKARYIHVGALCLVFPLLPVLTAGLLFRAVKSRDQVDPRPFRWVRMSTGLMVYLVPQTSFYIVILIGRRANPSDPHIVGFENLSYILLASLVGGAPIVVLDRFLRNPSDGWQIPASFIGLETMTTAA